MTRIEPPLDLLGIGFGPANLALAVAILEGGAGGHGGNGNGSVGERVLFLERQPRFAWHPGMLIDGMRLQVSFLKDLATLRNPQSPFTFLSYLKEHERLEEFINLRDFYPTRWEFNDYLAWAAARADRLVRYGRKVLAIEPVVSAGSASVDEVEVVAQDLSGERTESFRTRGLVLATGGTPNLPAGVEPGPRIFHSSECLHRLARDFSDRSGAHRFLVVGSGQSAAEIFYHLYRTYPNASVTAAFRRFAYKQVDGSHFVNEMFHARMAEFFSTLPLEDRLRWLDAHHHSNYSAVEAYLIEAIYRTLYEDRIAGRSRGSLVPFLQLLSAGESGGTAVVRFEDVVRGGQVEIEADAVVMATGYRRPRRHPLLEALAPHLVADESGGFVVDRDYRVATQPGFRPAIFMQGASEDTFGLGDSLLSIASIRAGRIFAAWRAALAAERTPVLEQGGVR
jgi:L-ornithine N5-monooxygenase